VRVFNAVDVDVGVGVTRYVALCILVAVCCVCILCSLVWRQ
jgi:hypothetical protein